MTTTTLDRSRTDRTETLRGELEQYVQSSYSSLVRTARRVVHQVTDAEEAVQEGLLAATRALPRFRGDAKLSTWLHTIVRNAALLLRRRRTRQEATLQDVLGSDSGHGNVELTGTEVDPADAFERKESGAVLRDVLESLPPRQAELLRWRDLEERSNEEIADLLGIRVGAVRVRVHRARVALRDQLAARERRTGSAVRQAA